MVAEIQKLFLQETQSAGHMTTITFIDGKQVDGPDREGLLGSDDDFLVFLSRASERAIPDCPENWAIERPLTSPAETMPSMDGGD